MKSRLLLPMLVVVGVLAGGCANLLANSSQAVGGPTGAEPAR
jgi:hypothetical protein